MIFSKFLPAALREGEGVEDGREEGRGEEPYTANYEQIFRNFLLKNIYLGVNIFINNGKNFSSCSQDLYQQRWKADECRAKRDLVCFGEVGGPYLKITHFLEII